MIAIKTMLIRNSLSLSFKIKYWYAKNPANKTGMIKYNTSLENSMTMGDKVLHIMETLHLPIMLKKPTNM